MPTKTWYVTNNAAVAPGWFGQLQDGGTAPTAASCSFGYAPGKLAINSFAQSRLGASGTSATSGTTSYVSAKTGPTAGTGATNTTAGDSFTTAVPYNGSFVAGTWTFTFNLIATTITLQGALGLRVWASVNQNGSSARELTSGEVFTSTVNCNTTATAQAATYSWSAPAITLNNEYLFFQVEWKELTAAGSNNTDAVVFRAGSSIVSTNYTGKTWVLNPATPGASDVTDSALKIWYKFEDTTTSDSSGNSNTGTLIGSPLPTLGTGKAGQGIVFNGGTGAVAVPPAAINVPSATSSFSIMAWVACTYTDRSIFGGRNSGNGNPIIDLELGFNAVDNTGTGKASILIRADDGSGLAYIDGTSAINDGTFHHVAGVYDGGAKTLTLYVDGIAQGASVSAPLTAGITLDATGCNIGYEYLNSSSIPAMVGTLDGFRFYNRALSSSEITTVYNAAEAGGVGSPGDVPNFTGAGGLVGDIVKYVPATIWQGSASLAGVGSLTAGIMRQINATAPILAPVGSLTAQAQLQLPSRAALAGTGSASWPTIDPIDQLLAATAALAGSGNETSALRALLGATSTLSGAGTASWPTIDPTDQWMVAYSALAGSGLLIGDVVKLTGATIWQGTALWVGASTQAAQVVALLPTTSNLAGSAALAAQTSVGLAARAALAGTGALTSTASQLLLASSALAGSGILIGDVIRLVGATLWQGTGLWTGASTLAAQAALGLPVKTALSGAGTASWPTIDPIDQLLVANAALVGASTFASSLLTLRPIAATFAGASTQLASVASALLGTAAFAGASTLASSLSQALQSSAAWTGASGALSSLTQQLSVSTAPLAGASTLTGNAPVLRAASATLAGSGALNAASAQWLANAATLGGAGLLAASQIQWQNIAASVTGTSAVTTDLYVPGHNVWSAALNTWPAAGALTAATTARFAAVSNLASASTLASSLTALSPISTVAAGTGQATATSSLQLAAQASGFPGAGALTGNYNQLLAINSSVLSGLGGLATTPAAQWMLATSALSGAGALTGDVTRFSGATLWSAILNPYSGTSALTAQTAQLLQGSLGALSGAGALSLTRASIIEPVTLSPAGQGSMAASAAQRMAVVSAAAGVGSLLADVTPAGVWQGNASLAGVGQLTAQTIQTLTARAQWAGVGTQVALATQNQVALSLLTGAGNLAGDVQKYTPGIWQGNASLLGAGNLASIQFTQTMAAGGLWPGAGALLPAEGMRLQARSLLAGTGLLQVDILSPRGLAALFAATSSLQATSRLMGSLVATQAGASSLSGRVTGILAAQSLLANASQLTAQLTAFEQVAGTLAAAGYSRAYLGQIQLLAQQLLNGAGVLGADLIQTSIRVVSGTIIGRPHNAVFIEGQWSARTLAGRPHNAVFVEGQWSARTLAGQPTTGSHADITGQGDFVSLH